MELSNTYEVEVTDTFGGEANYCWVNRYTFSLPLNPYGEGAKARKAYDRLIVKTAKALAGWTGTRCETYAEGGAMAFELRPRGMCQVMFIMYSDK